MQATRTPEGDRRRLLAKRFWNPERDKLLRKYREEDNLSISDCEKAFGGLVSYDAIQKRCSRLGIQRGIDFARKQRETWWLPERLAELYRLHAAGKFFSTIAEELNGGIPDGEPKTSVGAVASKCKRLGLRRRAEWINQGDLFEQLGMEKGEPKASFPPANNVLTFQRKSPQLWDLGDSVLGCECHWPIGDPLEDGFHFCGRDKRPGIPYCEDHADIAYGSRNGRAA